MAFAVGDRLRVRLSSTALAENAVQPQPPRLGVVSRVVAGAPDLISAVFEDGSVITATSAAVLDKLTAPSTEARDAYLDKMVIGSSSVGEYSQELTGRVVNVYVVQPGATGDSATRVLIQAANGVFYELPITLVSVIPNR